MTCVFSLGFTLGVFVGFAFGLLLRLSLALTAQALREEETMQQEDRLLLLMCSHCGEQMPRRVANGLKIGDAQATVMENFVQVCTACGHEHPAGTTLSYQIGAEPKELAV